MSREATLAKLERILGATRAQSATADAMRAAGIYSLESPEDRLKFGRALAEQGGVLAAIGRSIAIQAILEGADEGGQVPETNGWRY
jgi:hypothetical protein